MPWKLILTVAMKLGLDKWAKRKAAELVQRVLLKAAVKADDLARAATSDEDKKVNVHFDDVA